MVGGLDLILVYKRTKENKMNIQEIYDWAKSNNVLDSEIYVDYENGIIPLIEVFISKRNGKKIIVMEGVEL